MRRREPCTHPVKKFREMAVHTLSATRPDRVPWFGENVNAIEPPRFAGGQVFAPAI
jgi:hypothetical protein